MYWDYFKYVSKHRWLVMLECFKMGLIWRGLLHDLSKYSPAEFRAYARWFKGPWGVKFRGIADIKPLPGQIAWQFNKRDFEHAWLHHQHCNPHHWNFWVEIRKGGIAWAIMMPEVYAKEMLADWCAMSKAFNNNVWDWYEQNSSNMILHPSTRERLEALIEIRRNAPKGVSK